MRKTCDRALEAGFGNKRLVLDAVVCIYVHKTLVKSFYMAPTALKYPDLSLSDWLQDLDFVQYKVKARG